MAFWRDADEPVVTSPKLRCRELTGADCDRPVAIDAQNCGIPEHVVPPQPERMAPGRTSLPMGIARPRLTVDEDFDLIDDDDDDDDDEYVDDVIPPIHSGSLLVSATAQRAFTTRHQVLPEVAIREIRFLAAKAVEKGGVVRQDSGRLTLTAEKFTIYLSPNGRTVVGYRTRHYERTPTQVFARQPSRFGAGRAVRPPDRGEPLPIDLLRSTVDPSRVRMSSMATSQFAKCLGSGTKDPQVAPTMRRFYIQAFEHGVWSTGRDRSSYEVVHLGTRWVVASDSGAVILCVPSESGPGAD